MYIKHNQNKNPNYSMRQNKDSMEQLSFGPCPSSDKKLYNNVALTI